MFGAISLTSAQVGATVTEGAISGGAGFVKGCDTGVFSYVVREGHLARMYMDNRRALNSPMRVSINGEVLKVIDRAKMVAIKFKGADGAEEESFDFTGCGRRSCQVGDHHYGGGGSWRRQLQAPYRG